MKNPNPSEQDPIAAIFEFHNQVEGAVRKIHESGFDLKRLSIVGKDYHAVEHPVGYYSIGDRMIYRGKMIAFWSGLWEKLFGRASFFVSGVGPLLVAGPLVTWIDRALEGTAMMRGISALGVALVTIGIPKESVLQYEKSVKADNFLLILHGTPQEVVHAKDRWNYTQATETTVQNELVAVDVYYPGMNENQ